MKIIRKSLPPLIPRRNSFQSKLVSPLSKERGPKKNKAKPANILPQITKPYIRANNTSILKMLNTFNFMTKGVSIVKVHILSNYGGPKVSCCEMDFLSSDFQTVTVASVKCIDRPESNVRALNDGLRLETRWTDEWPPASPLTSYTLEFTLNNYDVKYINIFPVSDECENSINKILITTDNKVVYFGSLAKDTCSQIAFGNVDPRPVLANPTIMGITARDIVSIFYKNKTLLPCPYIIRIKPTSTYQNSKIFGLNQIALFDNEGKQVIDKVKVLCHESCLKCDKLVREIPEERDIFDADSVKFASGDISKDAYIDLVMMRPFFIGCIMFLNVRENEENERDVCTTKNLSVYFDKKKAWHGRIKRCCFSEVDEASNGSFVWFTDDKEYQERVKKSLPIRSNYDI